MRYKKFIIQNYRAITAPLEIDVDKPSLTPIIGINESGKTTILHAILAFDHYSDDTNDEGRHLQDTSNLYRASSPTATVDAVIEVSRADLEGVISHCESNSDNEDIKPQLSSLRRRRGLLTEVTIRRDLKTRKYSWDSPRFGSPEVQHVLAEEVIRQLPYILYFDDFRDKIDESIEIPAAKGDSSSGWISIIEQLFKQTDKSLSVYDVPGLEERQRMTVLAKVKRHLNSTLTKEWQNFKLDNRDALKISIDYYQDSKAGGTSRHYLKFGVVETDSAGEEHFFYISDRSKGFYWFFNFVMKLEFNPKVVEESDSTIYLLDEPGSYLHAFAQRKLCQKLRQLSNRNRVIYCTHSHYLLDPDTVPVSKIAVADKDDNGNVSLVPIGNYRGRITQNRSALQPVLDALQVKPFALDVITTRATVITEGMYDYFAIELFKGDRSISILPSVGAESIKYYISLLIAWQVEFRALWDRDPEGMKRHAEATKLFGSEIADHNLRLLPTPSNEKRRIMQDLFEGSDLVMIRSALGLPSDCSFERTLHVLFYSPRRKELVQAIGVNTRRNFEALFTTLSLD